MKERSNINGKESGSQVFCLTPHLRLKESVLLPSVWMGVFMSSWKEITGCKGTTDTFQYLIEWAPINKGKTAVFFVPCIFLLQLAKCEDHICCWTTSPEGRLCLTLRQFYVLPHWDRSCRPSFPSHPVTVYWHWVSQSQHWPYNARHLAGWPLEYQSLSHLYDSTPEKSWHKQDLNPGSSAHEADALTTRPTRQLEQW